MTNKNQFSSSIGRLKKHFSKELKFEQKGNYSQQKCSLPEASGQHFKETSSSEQ